MIGSLRPALASALAALLLGACAAANSSDPAPLPSTAGTAAPLKFTLVTAGGVTQALACSGSGGPTVVYVNGLIIPADFTWTQEVDRQAESSRVCAIDRAGTGQSPQRPASATTNGPVANAAEMIAALKAAGEPGPYVFVGWSYGGMVARTAAALFPSDAAGLVLVDGVTPTQYRTFDRRGWVEAGSGLDMRAGEEAVGTVGPDLGGKPLVVLQAGAGEGNRREEQIWANMQRQASRISANSVLGVVTGTGHTIPQQAPSAVIAATGAVLESARDSDAPMPDCPAGFPAAGIECLAD